MAYVTIPKDLSRIQGPVQADQTTSDLFRSGGTGRRAAFLFGNGEPRYHHSNAGSVPGTSDPEQIHSPEGVHLPDQ